MAIDKTGQFWRGADFNVLAEYVREFEAGGYAVSRIRELICPECGGKTFGLDADDDAGCARARCLTCRAETYLADSDEFADGLRCLQDGTLGVYADWKIDYSPTSHLLTGTTELQ